MQIIVILLPLLIIVLHHRKLKQISFNKTKHDRIARSHITPLRHSIIHDLTGQLHNSITNTINITILLLFLLRTVQHSASLRFPRNNGLMCGDGDILLVSVPATHAQRILVSGPRIPVRRIDLKRSLKLISNLEPLVV